MPRKESNNEKEKERFHKRAKNSPPREQFDESATEEEKLGISNVQ